MNLRALLELCRISNLPTVWSNSLLGLLAGLYIFDEFRIEDLANHRVAITAFGTLFALSMSMIYCGGMIMNDWADRAIDQNERPNRPIPSGRVTVKAAQGLMFLMFFWALVLILIISGLGALTPMGSDAGVTALVLIACVTLYNFAHQYSPLAIVFMALCRAMIILCGVLIVGSYEQLSESSGNLIYLIGPAATLFAYTLLISIVARREMETKRFAGPKTIMNMIAGMPLLDAAWLLLMGLWPASLFCVACSVMTKLGHRKVAGS